MSANLKKQPGLPFVGNSGKLLHKLLQSIKLNRSEVFIANIFKHRPPGNRNPLPDEISVCPSYLKAQLKIIIPKIVITLGRFAKNFIPVESITRLRGQIRSVVWQDLLLTIIPVYHPPVGFKNYWQIF
ncbi:uracil-DNA glycosylase [Patescibacteria group bacterium]|nr:uracil-DNA glycosylase [Patescibacteria group bacterium]